MDEGKELKEFSRNGVALSVISTIGFSSFGTFGFALVDEAIIGAMVSPFCAGIALLVTNFTNFSGIEKRYVTPAGWFACVPGVGRMVRPEKILSSKAPYAFVKGSQFALGSRKENSLSEFLDENDSTGQSWDRLFRQEVNSGVYDYVIQTFWVNDHLVSLGSKESTHAWYVGNLHLDRKNSFRDRYPSCLKDKLIYRSKIVKAKRKGEYIPIHWEKIATSY